MLFPTDDRDASRSPPPARPAGVTLLQSPLQIFAGAPKASTFPRIGPTPQEAKHVLGSLECCNAQAGV